MASIKCGNCKATHTSISEVRACHPANAAAEGNGFREEAEALTNRSTIQALVMAGAGAPAASQPVDRFAGLGQPVVVPPTEAQVGFLDKLLAERQHDFPASYADAAKADASQMRIAIDTLVGRPKAAKPAAASTDEPVDYGMYKQARTGDLFRVYPARQGGHLLSKRLIILEDGSAEFMYEGAAKRNVKASEKMTLEEAKAFGHQFGVCCMCAALLTDPESVAAGIGPVCAGKV